MAIDRGRDNLLHIVAQLAERTSFASVAERAQAIAHARGAAPIRFVRRARATRA